MRIALATPANNERSPRYAEKALAAIHQALPSRTEINLEFGSSEGQAGLFLRLPQSVEPLVRGPLLANYPQCTLTACDDDTLPNGWSRREETLFLSPELYPLLRHAQFEDLLNGNFADPINSLLQAVVPESELRSTVILTVRVASAHRRHAARTAIRQLDGEFFRRHHWLAEYFARRVTRPGGWATWLLGQIVARRHEPHRSPLDVTSSRTHDREDDLQAAAEKVGSHLFEATLTIRVETALPHQKMAADRMRQLRGALGAFTRSRLATFESRSHSENTKRRFLLSHEELATLWHPPTGTVSTEKMRQTPFTELEAPPGIPTGGIPGGVPLGRVLFRQDTRQCGLLLEDRRRHVYIVGKTGMGKSTLLQNMMASDMRQGLGICLIDPHGDLAESLLGVVPSFRTNDVIYFNPAAAEHAVPFNPLACPDRSKVDQVTSGVVSAFKKVNTSWGPRLEETLRNAVFAVAEQGGNLLTLLQLLGDRFFREHFVAGIKDDIVRGFFQNEFACWSEAYRTEAIASIQNKVRPFLTYTRIRAVVTSEKPSLDLRHVMDHHKILIVNLSKGRLGEDNSALLGAFLVSSIQMAAMSRADVPEEQRSDFFLYVDEFQNFTTGSFAILLSEARKYRVGTVLAHQYLAQLSEETANAVWGNVGSMLAFQVGSEDAEKLAVQFSRFPGEVRQQDFGGLPKFTAYARVLVNGAATRTFSMMTFQQQATDGNRARHVRSSSRRRDGQRANPSILAI